LQNVSLELETGKKVEKQPASKAEQVPPEAKQVSPVPVADESEEEVQEPLAAITPNAAAAAKSAPVVKEEKDNSRASTLTKQVDNTIRVDVERLDDLLNIVSELVLGRNRLAQVNAEVSLEYEGTKLSRDLAEASKQIDLMTTELQLAVMKTRMVKIGKVFNRFPRLVRDLSKEMKKEIQLVINGEETELEKPLLKKLMIH
jgi:two-component system chemotaxis sensor kinase CheA